MDLLLGVGPEKAGGIVIETGSVQTSIIESALTGETTKGLLSEMTERENPLYGGMIVHLVVIVLGTKL